LIFFLSFCLFPLYVCLNQIYLWLWPHKNCSWFFFFKEELLLMNNRKIRPSWYKESLAVFQFDYIEFHFLGWPLYLHCPWHHKIEKEAPTSIYVYYFTVDEESFFFVCWELYMERVLILQVEFLQVSFIYVELSPIQIIRFCISNFKEIENWWIRT